MLKKLFVGKFRSITSAALVISFAGLASRILGVVRDRVLAGTFGAGIDLDMYYAAFRIPDLMYNIIIFGALSAGFIPIFSALVKSEDRHEFKDNRSAWLLVNNVVTIFSIALIVVGVTLFVFADYLVPLIAPGFEGTALETTIRLTRIMFASPILLGISGIFGGVLQTFKRFFAYSIAPLLYNVGIIFGAMYLVPSFGLAGLAYGVIIGATLHLLIQFTVAVSLGFRFRLKLDLKDKNMRQIFKMMVPRVLSLATSQVNLLVVTVFGSMIAAGSIAVYNFATNLQTVPVGLVGISYAIATFPALSKSFAHKRYTDFKQVFRQTFRMILFVIVPLTVIFIVLRIQIVRVILGSGAFDWHDTMLTADALGLFSVSLFAQALIPLLARAFFARHNTWIPFMAGLVSAAVNIVLSYFLMQTFEVLGLVIAFSVSSIINFILLFIGLRWKIGDFGEGEIFLSFMKSITAGIVMGAVIQSLKEPIAQYVDMQAFWGISLQGIGASAAGLLVFAVICHWLNCPEYKIFVGGVKKRLFKKVEIDESMRSTESITS